MSKIHRMVFFLYTSIGFAYGQTEPDADRFMVFLRDKEGTPFEISKPKLFLTPLSIGRRVRQSISITEADLPVNPVYVQEISKTGATVIFKTKWMNGVLVEANANQLLAIQNLSFVSRTEYVAKGKTGSTGRMAVKSKFKSSSSAEASQNQNAMLGLDEMHKDGITGSGVTIAILDTGFPGVLSNPAFNNIIAEGRIKDSYNFSIAVQNAFTGDKHGAQVFSTIAASLPEFSGGAFGASFLLYATEFVPTEYRVEEYNWLFAAERADSAGADIISSSLGYTDFDDPSMDYLISELDGKTSIVTQAASMAFNRGIVVVASAGNYGSKSWRYVSPPADAENVLAVGSVESNYEHSYFSSIGPTADGRIKPDVMALGGGAATVLPDGSIYFTNGTSFSCPLISSLVAGIMQHWPELTADQIINLVRQSGSKAFNPDNINGYGIPTYKAIENILEFPAMGASEIAVYPNPVTDEKLSVAISQSDMAITFIKIFNMLGQQVAEANYQTIWYFNPFNLDMAGLAPGLYVVLVENKDRHRTFRIIKR